MSRLLLALAIMATGFAGLAVSAEAAGPAPGISNGPEGIVAPGGELRYVALSRGADTVVEKVRVGGRVVAQRSIAGAYGIPRIAWDGETAGLTSDGRSLVLSTFPGLTPTTRLLVLDTRTLAVRTRVTLHGVWSFDALSPDGHTLYLIQYLADQGYPHYLVRAYDLTLGRLVKGAIADKTETGPMAGSPLMRVTSTDGTWVFTLYQRGNGAKPFIHALDTRDRVAVCIDLAWLGTDAQLARLRLTLSADQRQLVFRRLSDGKAMLMVAVPG